MKISLIIDIILFAGAAQGFMLTLALLFYAKGNKKANRILAALLFIFSFIIFFHSLGEINSAGTVIKNTGGVESHGLILLIGPLFLFYVKALTEPGFRFRYGNLIHLIPSIAVLTINALITISGNTEKAGHLFETIVIWLLIIQAFAYFTAAIIKLYRYVNDIKKSFSTIDKISLGWLRYLTAGNVIIWPLALIAEIYKNDSAEWSLIWVLVSIMIYLIGFKALKQSAVFSVGGEEESSFSSEEKKKYEKSGLSAEQADLLFQKLQSYMSSAKPYLESSLTLPLLAKNLGVSTHHLSRIINEKEGVNFYEYVNLHRVEEAKKLLADWEKKNLTISTIGLEAGFNSVSSFNSVFKKYTNQTPSQYQKSVKQLS